MVLLRPGTIANALETTCVPKPASPPASPARARSPAGMTNTARRGRSPAIAAVGPMSPTSLVPAPVPGSPTPRPAPPPPSAAPAPARTDPASPILPHHLHPLHHPHHLHHLHHPHHLHHLHHP